LKKISNPKAEKDGEHHRNMLDDMLDETKEMTPKMGFNIVEFDDFAPPGEMLTLVAHTETREEAEKVKKQYQKKAELLSASGSAAPDYFIYGHD